MLLKNFISQVINRQSVSVKSASCMMLIVFS